MAAAVRVKGYREFDRALGRASAENRKVWRDQNRQAGEIVRRDAQARFAPYSPRSAAGYRTVVRQRGVAVEQRFRRTTGRHPEFGVLQMKEALMPAVSDNIDAIDRQFEQALGRMVERLAR